MTRRALRRSILVLASCAWLLCPQVARGQTPPAEADLVARLVQQPQDVAALLDLAKIYARQSRLDEAEDLLSRAMAALRQQAAIRQWRFSPASLPARAAARQPPPLRVFGGIMEPRRTTYVAPVYPEIARAAGVQGVVIIEVTVDPQGHVTEPRVLRSIALLDRAALEAVRQWTYTPTLLNGIPVAVVMTVTVTFSLT